MEMKPQKTVQADEFKKLLASGEVRQLIDVRTPAEFEACHVRGALNVPLNQLGKGVMLQSLPTFLICKSGSRSKQAQEQLAACGIETICVEGGTEGAQVCGVPVELSSRQVISLERQVRIIAGILILLGMLGSLVISPLMLLLPTFVGAGLVFAGITDWCGMARVLGYMPWNQSQSSLRKEFICQRK